MRFRFIKAVIISTFLISTLQTNATPISQHHLPRLAQAPVIDGSLDETIWQQAAKITLDYENDPGEGIAAPVKTNAYVYEDGQYLYIAFEAFDPNPDDIRASYRKRDDLNADDNVGVIIDTFNDKRNGFSFFANPMGAQADKTVEDNAGLNEDDSWDAIWDSAGQVNTKGYVVEMAIPFRALRFAHVTEPSLWNIGFYRNYPRAEWTALSNVAFDRNINCTLCQFDGFKGFADVQPGNNLQLTPTLTLGRTDLKDVEPQPHWQNGDNQSDVGLDVRWGITKNAVVNATINPDFSQVEADSAQLDVNNTFSLFYDEKRPFFLDGADYFSTSNFNLVHTRNIADPDYGAKITGKTGVHSYGLMVADDNSTSFLLPGRLGDELAVLDIDSKVAIARYKMDVGEQNNVGVLLTNRNGDGYRNQLASVDGSYWFDGNNQVQYQVARSDSKNPLQLQQDFGLEDTQTGNAYFVQMTHENRDFDAYVNFKRVDKGFRADLGFISQANYERGEVGGSRTWYLDSDNWFSLANAGGNYDKTRDLDGNLLEEEWEVYASAEGKMQYYGDVNLLHRKRLFNGQYFDEDQLSVWNEFTPVGGLLVAAFIQPGKVVDVENSRLSDSLNLEAYVQWQINKHFNFDTFHIYNQLEHDGEQVLTANLTQVKLTWQFNMRSRLSLITQYTRIDRNLTNYEQPDWFDAEERYLSSQLLYSYEINPQTLVYLGYSDNSLQDYATRHLLKTDRTLFAKFSYAWQL
ncbi:carbohydrate binding family 9 domain-containing protein [Neptunicella marina]|uniref:Carbohydrate binding family 9 domain-containing protein n=1 Tax=Neptunicella marina TaxID=2125989 RepID=A0A8J6M0L0_9ALTE|nr:carbohydrate binding family 9 domain-containing protein [Neptunicella marina]MBC3767480.1 carbohydrate binding family 9 domain-containing protein [Neptunicella marina]